VRVSVVICLAIFVIGCGRSEPVLSGGKPVGYWVEALRGPDAKLRKQAAAKLGNAGAGDAAVLPALREALKDRDAAVRREAILALLKCGPAAGEAVPELAALRQGDRDPRVRSYAARAVEALRRDK
jgi:HEAT repeat protein